MRNVSDRSCIEDQTHILYSVTFFSETLAVFKIMWKNMTALERPQMTLQSRTENTQFSCWINKARIQTLTQNI